MVREGKPCSAKQNRGSAVIEMTLLMPVFLGCIYFYIMFFLFLFDSSNQLQQMAEVLYQDRTAEDETAIGQTEDMVEAGVLRKEGEVLIIELKKEGKLFDTELELRRADDEDVVKKLRRWQFAADLF